MMTPVENLHYAIGELAYAVACADGTVQKEERKKFHDIIEKELRSDNYEFDISGIIFQIMDKDTPDYKVAYKWAMDEIRMNSHYLSPDLKHKFIRVMEQVAVAFPPVTRAEKSLLEKFRKDIADINGDPVFYEKTL